MTTLKETQWHDLDAWQMENEALCIAAIPAPGGKLVSIRDKRYDLEWLVQPHKPVFPTIEDPSDYHKNSGFGWDEHFPNLLPGPQPAPGAFHQRELPRAGEVWAKRR